MTRSILVYGCGGHGEVVADAAISSGTELLGFADDDENRRHTAVGEHRVLAIGMDDAARVCEENDAGLVIAIGNNQVRAATFLEAGRRGLKLATVVHSTAIVARTARIGVGSVVFARAVINSNARIGQNAILNTGVIVEHDNQIGDHAHLSPGVVLGGTVTVGEGAHVAIGASVRNNVSIGAWTVVGVGAAVVRSLPDRVVAVGVPARIVKRVVPHP